MILSSILIISAPNSDISTDQGGVVYFVDGNIPQGVSIPTAQYYGTEDFAGVGGAVWEQTKVYILAHRV